MTCSAGSFTGLKFCLIFAPSKGYDEPETLPSSIRTGADAGQSLCVLKDPIGPTFSNVEGLSISGVD
jgi:hypothetical protein